MAIIICRCSPVLNGLCTGVGHAGQHDEARSHSERAASRPLRRPARQVRLPSAYLTFLMYDSCILVTVLHGRCGLAVDVEVDVISDAVLVCWCACAGCWCWCWGAWQCKCSAQRHKLHAEQHASPTERALAVMFLLYEACKRQPCCKCVVTVWALCALRRERRALERARREAQKRAKAWVELQVRADC